MTSRPRRPLVVTALSSLLSFMPVLGGCSGGTCTAEGLTGELAAAAPGDTVSVGACTVLGAFSVPAGVTLSGGGPSSVVGSIEGALPVLSLADGASVRGLAIQVDHGGAGIAARSSGTVTLADLEIRVSRGIGVGLSGVGGELRGLEINGPITRETADFASMSPAETGTFGVVARELGAAALTLTAVHISGFSVAGASISGGRVDWTGSATGADVESNRGVGIALFGTDAMLDSVEVSDMLSGVGMPGIGVAVADLGPLPGLLEGSALTVASGDGYGLFSDHAEVTLADASFSDLGLSGVRLQGGTLVATDLVCERDGGAGLMAIDTESVSVERGRLAEQREALFVTAVSSVRVADGLEMLRDPLTAGSPPIDLTLIDVTLARNARAGMVLDAAGGAIATLTLERVTAEAEGTGFGAITQRTTVPPGWDAMVTRTGVAAVNDGAFAGMIDVVGIMMPPGLVAAPPDF